MAARPRVKHIPQRTCVACRAVLPKRQLVRIVRTVSEAGEVQVKIDPTGKANGRGAYLHNRRSCWETALKNGALERALKIKLSDADWARLHAHGQQYSDEIAD
ncbi:MAG: YlxR family protein [Anaerolineales bacterium]|nr:YlxR family protein [Anaerolineales bacterium]